MQIYIDNPSICLIKKDNKWEVGQKHNKNEWGIESVKVKIVPEEHKTRILLESPECSVEEIRFRWENKIKENVLILNDHWERGYGDLRWQNVIPEKKYPWYMVVSGKTGLFCYGVMTRPGAICHWEIDQNGISLILDVRNGTQGVLLKERTLEMASIILDSYSPEVCELEATHLFCKKLCVDPIFPHEPVYGGNNWYYAYGKSSHTEIIEDSKRIAKWSKDLKVKPFMVIDDGWQAGYQVCSGGPWNSDKRKFPDMERLAKEMSDIGVQPGIWYRPLLSLEKRDKTEILSHERFPGVFPGEILDPSHPEVLKSIASDISMFVDWGYRLIKYDFSTFDIFGKWGFEMDEKLSKGDWHFSDTEKTTAEIITNLYKAIYDASKGAYLIGCNTIGHLGAGYIHIQRTGDDTSGQEWERTRKMGINTLAYRMPQHKAFFYVDADCVGITPDIPWEMNKQWLDVLAKSQTPLFISANPKSVNNEVEKAIIEAFKIASMDKKTSKPLDWMLTSCPSRWESEFGIDEYDWFNPIQKATSKIHSTI